MNEHHSSAFTLELASESCQSLESKLQTGQ